MTFNLIWNLENTDLLTFMYKFIEKNRVRSGSNIYHFVAVMIGIPTHIVSPQKSLVIKIDEVYYSKLGFARLSI